MWGSIFLESSIQQNFNFGFSSHKSDILLHLSQWQYWWWFWFSLVWVLYFYLILTVVTRRFNTFNPVLNTSLRGHGKWGDFLVALIPLSWCGNILVNSNFILRMIEWQNESSLFTLRIQGKQWYWVYKFDISAVHNIAAAPKNIGHNRWYFNVANETYIADSYVQAMNLAAQIEFFDDYQKFLKKNMTTSYTFSKNINNSNYVLINNSIIKETNTGFNFNNLFTKNFRNTNKISLKTSFDNKLALLLSNFVSKNINKETSTQLDLINNYVTNRKFSTPQLDNTLPSNTVNASYLSRMYVTNQTWEKLYTGLLPAYFLPQLDSISDTSANIYAKSSTVPLRLHQGVLNQHNQNIIKHNDPVLVLFKLTNNTSTTFVEKPFHVENYWGFRQKKYKRPTKLIFSEVTTYDPQTLLPTNAKPIKTQPTLFNNQKVYINSPESNITKKTVDNVVYFQNRNINFLDENNATVKNVDKVGLINYYDSIKNNRLRDDLLSVNLSRRLLRTKRTLVLPAHVNITVITNSYDVVHSWFIPGLGIKLDCVPGRSTHHTFYVDNVGFYYGQCAEICGRYHHHMPIRICALPFEHFLVWWQTKGYPRLARLNSKIGSTKDSQIMNSNLQYKW